MIRSDTVGAHDQPYVMMKDLDMKAMDSRVLVGIVYTLQAHAISSLSLSLSLSLSRSHSLSLSLDLILSLSLDLILSHALIFVDGLYQLIESWVE